MRVSGVGALRSSARMGEGPGLYGVPAFFVPIGPVLYPWPPAAALINNPWTFA